MTFLSQSCPAPRASKRGAFEPRRTLPKHAGALCAGWPDSLHEAKAAFRAAGDAEKRGYLDQMSPEDSALALQLQGIFMPYAMSRRDALLNRNGRFVHYTSAESGLSIIRTRQMWLRNAMCMADYSEVQHGGGLLQRFFGNDANKTAFMQAMDTCGTS